MRYGRYGRRSTDCGLWQLFSKSCLFHWLLFGLGCVTTHSHQQKHQGYIEMLICAAWLCQPWTALCIKTSSLYKWRQIAAPKTACGCPCGRIILKNGHSRSPLTLSNVFVNVQFHIPGDPKNARLGNITTRAITTILTSVQLLPSFASAGSIFAHSLAAEEGLLPYPKYSYAFLNVWKITCWLSASSVILQTAMLNWAKALPSGGISLMTPEPKLFR